MHRSTAAASGLLLALTSSCGSGSPSSSRLFDVHGVVIDAVGPALGAIVVVSGKSVATASDGTFTVSGVTAPYDAWVRASGSSHAFLYLGLHRPDPTLWLNTPATHTATIGGALSGGAGYPDPAGYATRVFAAAPEITDQYAPVSSSSYQGWLYWAGPSSITVTLGALQWSQGPSGLPASYRGYATRSVTISDGQAVLGQDLALAPVGTSTAFGTIAYPASYGIGGRALRLVIAGSEPLLFEDLTPATADFAYFVPVIPGTGFELASIAWGPAGEFTESFSYGLSAGKTASLSVAPAPSLSSPPKASSGVAAGTAFSWTPYVGGLHQLFIYPVAAAGPELTVFTQSASLPLPDLAAVGLSWPAGTSFEWWVKGFYSDIDALAGNPPPPFDPGHDAGYAGSATFSFATP